MNSNQLQHSSMPVLGDIWYLIRFHHATGPVQRRQPFCSHWWEFGFGFTLANVKWKCICNLYARDNPSSTQSHQWPNEVQTWADQRKLCKHSDNFNCSHINQTDTGMILNEKLRDWRWILPWQACIWVHTSSRSQQNHKSAQIQ